MQWLWWLRNQTGSLLLFLSTCPQTFPPTPSILPFCLCPSLNSFYSFYQQSNMKLLLWSAMLAKVAVWPGSVEYQIPWLQVEILGNSQVIFSGGKVSYLIITALHRNHLLFIPPSLNPPAPHPRHPLSFSSHQKIQFSHSWVTEAGCILSLLRRFLNPSQAEPSQENTQRRYQCDFLFSLKLCSSLSTPPVWWGLSSSWYMCVRIHMWGNKDYISSDKLRLTGKHPHMQPYWHLQIKLN